MKYLYVFCLLFLFSTASAFAQRGGAFLEQIENVRSAFTLRVEVNHPNRMYTKDDVLQTTVESSEEGYLFLFYRDAAGNVSMLFPNRFKRNNVIRKDEVLVIPAAESVFQIRIDAPFGKELIKAIVSKEPLTYFDQLDLTGINTLPIDEQMGRALAASLKTLKSSDWAECQAVIHTVDPERPIAAPRKVVKRPLLKRLIFWFKNGRN